MVSKLFSRLPLPKYSIIGHRGLAGHAPENTLASFNAAAHVGLNWVEFDIQRCATGEWVVFHDQTLSRTTNQQGLLKETPYEILKTLDVGTWFHPQYQNQYKNERIPTLQEALACLASLKIHPNIEIKIFPENKDDSKEEAMIDFLKNLQTSWPNTLQPPLVSSFDLESLQILRSLDTNLPLGYIVKHPNEDTVDLILQEKFDSLHCYYLNLSSVLLAQARSKSVSIPILAHTVNNADQLRSLLDRGVTAVFSEITHSLTVKTENI